MDKEDLFEKRLVRSQLRLPADLHEKITNLAESNGRSMNAEIITRLEASFPDFESQLLRTRLGELAKLEAQLRDRKIAVHDLAREKTTMDEHGAPEEEKRIVDTQLAQAQVNVAYTERMIIDLAVQVVRFFK